MNPQRTQHNDQKSSWHAQKTTEELRHELDLMLRRIRNFQQTNDADVVENDPQWRPTRVTNSIFFPESTMVDSCDVPYYNTEDLLDCFCRTNEEKKEVSEKTDHDCIQIHPSFTIYSNRVSSERKPLQDENLKNKTKWSLDSESNIAEKRRTKTDDIDDSNTMEVFDRYAYTLKENKRLAGTQNSRNDGKSSCSKTTDRERGEKRSMLEMSKQRPDNDRNKSEKERHRLQKIEDANTDELLDMYCQELEKMIPVSKTPVESIENCVGCRASSKDSATSDNHAERKRSRKESGTSSRHDKNGSSKKRSKKSGSDHRA